MSELQADAAIRAGHIMLEQLKDLATQRVNFAFETTLAGRAYAKWLDSLRATGYKVHLFYFWLSSPELAIARVAARVKKGGHDIPEETIRRRYDRSIKNLFDLYMPIATTWQVYNNSFEGKPQLIAFGDRDQPATIVDSECWLSLKRSNADG